MKNKDPQTCAEAYGNAVIADAGNKGAMGSISLKAEATAELLEEKEIICPDEKIKEFIGKLLAFFEKDQGVKVEVKSEIPEDLGFGEKEAMCVAACLAVTGAIARKYGSINEIKIDKYMRDQLYIVDEKIVNKKDLIDLILDSGYRLDRVYACFYGGFSVCDNTKREVMRNGEMETLHAVVLKPEKPEKMDLKDMMVFDSETNLIFEEALKGNLNTAMKLNAAIYERKISGRMISAGAIAVSGSREGGFVAFTREEDKIDAIKEAVSDLGETIACNSNNIKAHAVARPKRIYKIPEFLELRKDQKYDWL